jgi:septal ring factor EnvC (AmiA/AmiB activator)
MPHSMTKKCGWCFAFVLLASFATSRPAVSRSAETDDPNLIVSTTDSTSSELNRMLRRYVELGQKLNVLKIDIKALKKRIKETEEFFKKYPAESTNNTSELDDYRKKLAALETEYSTCLSEYNDLADKLHLPKKYKPLDSSNNSTKKSTTNSTNEPGIPSSLSYAATISNKNNNTSISDVVKGIVLTLSVTAGTSTLTGATGTK